MLQGPLPTLAALAQAANRNNEQLQLIFQGWVAIALLAAVGALGIGLIALLLAVWRRSLRREQRLEADIREVRSRLAAIGDAWAASATRIPGFTPRSNDAQNDPDDDDLDEDDEDDDPYDLFGGHDPLDRNDEDEDEDDFDDEQDDDRPPPGF